MLWKFFRAFSFSNSNEFKDEKNPCKDCREKEFRNLEF